jgi:hypothetical protein
LTLNKAPVSAASGAHGATLQRKTSNEAQNKNKKINLTKSFSMKMSF